MRTYALVGVVALACSCARSEIIAQWTFNGTDTPTIGSGSASLVGGATVSFASGCPLDTAGGNTAWNTSSYPAQGTADKTAGVEFRVSTQGYSDVSITWEQRLSATASKYLRVQYSTDGVNFKDLASGGVASTRTLAFESQAVSMGGVPGVDDNPLFAFRVVSEFESSALGSGTAGYVTTYGTNTYSRSGTIRYDLMTVSGKLIAGANTPPIISKIADQSLRVGQVSAPLVFTVSDQQDSAENLVVTGTASDPGVIAEVVISGLGAERELRAKAGSSAGTARVSTTVSDTGGLSSSTDFGITVLPLNTAPFIGPVAGTNVLCGGETEAISFLVGDLESDAELLTVSAVSADAVLVPNDGTHISLGGAGSNRTVQVKPAQGQVGVAPITVSVSDGMAQASSIFAVAVRPFADVILYDPFSYADGSVCTNSGSFWRNQSGVDGECQVRGGALELMGSRTEDVLASLAGGPYARSNGTVLYASFKFSFVTAPKSTPEYFAHFVGGSALRGRIYAGAVDVWPGAFKLYVANGSDTNRALPWNLSTNTIYTAVTRYEVDSALTTLWVNPSAESDPGTAANDPQSAVAISGYGFRQDNGLGTTVVVDDLKVGLSFAAVTGRWATNQFRLGIENGGAGEVVLRWENNGAVLQAGEALDGLFVDVPRASSPYTNVVQGAAMFFRLREK